jgi:hypothetical protein
MPSTEPRHRGAHELRLDAQHTEAILNIVERHRPDRAGKDLAVGWAAADDVVIPDDGFPSKMWRVLSADQKLDPTTASITWLHKAAPDLGCRAAYGQQVAHPFERREPRAMVRSSCSV